MLALQSSESERLFCNFVDTDFEHLDNDIVDEAVNEFVKILDFVAKKLLNLVKTKKKGKRICQPWYDTDCHTLKKKLKHVSNQKHKEPYNKITRLNYHHMNKEYKHLLKQKK